VSQKRRSDAPGTAFLKVEGAGNDFVLLDARAGKAPRLRSGQIRRLLDRHRGVGGDGLLLLLRTGAARSGAAASSGVRVRYWNADGGAASFCGNGARCVALLLLRESPRVREVSFRFGNRRLFARRGGGSLGAAESDRGKETAGSAAAGRVAVLVPEPLLLPKPRRLPPIPSGAARWAWVDSGVPHWLLSLRNLESVDLGRLAPPIRFCRSLGPEGTNVDLVDAGRGIVRVRTWERGVEGETLACGSGLVAAGWWAAAALGASWPVRLRSRGGDEFLLSRDAEGRGLWLEGPTRIAFAGRLDEPPG
jgi:diaminopimelate epimerase